MTKVIPFSGYSIVIAGFIWCLGCAAPAFAEDSGYEGLIAPSTPESTAPPAATAPAAPDTSSGYEGLIAPAPSSHTNNTNTAKPQKEEPLGYSGLIPGRVEQPPPPQVTASPSNPSLTPKNSEDIKMLATVHGMQQDIEKPGVVSKKTALALAKPHPRIDNMLPLEYAAKKNIDDMMPGIRDKKISKKVRAERVRNTHEKLATLAAGLRQKKSVPDRIYKAMGVPDSFIKEEREGTDHALLRLDKALQELKAYE
jgi:hypothetical protein